jgi:hypothetical protein
MLRIKLSKEINSYRGPTIKIQKFMGRVYSLATNCRKGKFCQASGFGTYGSCEALVFELTYGENACTLSGKWAALIAPGLMASAAASSASLLALAMASNRTAVFTTCMRGLSLSILGDENREALTLRLNISLMKNSCAKNGLFKIPFFQS